MTSEESSTPPAPKGKLQLPLELEQRQLDWLASMAEAHGLPDADKVLRIVLTYAREPSTSEQIFRQVQQSEPQELAPSKPFTVEDFHVSLLDTLAAQHGLKSRDQAARKTVAFAALHGDEATIFGTIRCKHGATCSHCKS